MIRVQSERGRHESDEMGRRRRRDVWRMRVSVRPPTTDDVYIYNMYTGRTMYGETGTDKRPGVCIKIANE